MFQIKFLRNIFLSSLLVIILLSAYNIFISYPSFEKQLIENTEDEANRVSNYLVSNIISDKLILSKNDFSSKQFHLEINQIIKDFKIYKLRIFSASGEIIFSTDTQEVGDINKKDYFHNVVAKGQRFTKTATKGGISMEGIPLNISIAETYVPIMSDLVFVGAFEIYYDITDRKKNQNKLLMESTIFSLFSSLILLVFILLFMKKRLLILKKHKIL